MSGRRFAAQSIIAASFLCFTTVQSAVAQVGPAANPSQTALPAAVTPGGVNGGVPGPGSRPMTMDFPADGIELKTLADIVTRQLKIPIIYNDQILATKKVIIHVPVDVPDTALMGVLQSALRMNQLALIDADQPGWKQIVAASNLAAVARPVAAGDVPDAGSALVQVFPLKHIDATRAIEGIRSFLTSPGGTALAVPGQKTIIITDYASVVTRVGQIINLLDADTQPVETQFIALKNSEASQIATAAGQLLANKETSQNGAVAAGAPGSASGIFLAADERTNQVVAIAPANRMAEVVELINGMDKPLDLKTRVYALKAISPDRVDKVVRGLLGASAKREYQSSVDGDSQSLVVSATPAVLARLDTIVKELDIPQSEVHSPIRFYKLKNTKAADVLATINSLYGENTSGPSNRPFAPTDERDIQRYRSPRDVVSQVPPIGVSQPIVAATPRSTNAAGMNGAGLNGAASPSANDPLSPTYGTMPTPAFPGQFRPEGGMGLTGAQTPNATVTADVNTNSIIVIAPPATQTVYEQLIKRLDERRPQVQIECTIVSLNTTDNTTFGVDIGREGASGKSALISFSSFGVSSVNPANGALTPINAPGGTFALLSPRIADVVLNALKTTDKARLVSAPQILVNDNGKGKLESVAQEPFAEILDTGTTQSRTGLGGQAEAGTTITVEPHISEADYLQLTYSIELSSFTGTSTNGLPPPSQKNTVDSTVTIPDGYTIVVGGLRQKDFRATVNTLPFVDSIPIVRWLIGSRSRSNIDTTIFVFLRPVILRDDKFSDLKFLSGRVTKEVNIPGDLPKSKPIPMR